MDMSMKDQSQKSPLQIWKDSHNVISLPESEGGPLHSSWQEYQQALDSGQDHPLASRLALPVSLSDLTMNDTSRPFFSVSSESASLNTSLANRLQQQLENTGSILYSLTWKKKATPVGRQYCQRAASVRRIKETECSLVRHSWTTPEASDGARGGTGITSAMTGSSLPQLVKSAAWPSPTANSNDRSASEKNAISMYREDGSKIQQRLQDFAAIAAWPTPVANDDNKTPEAHLRMKQRMGERDGTGANRKAITSLQVMAKFTQPVRITASGQMLTGSAAGMESTGQLNPAHSRWLMGFPPEWDDCAVTAMPSSRSVRQISSKPSPDPQPNKKVRIRAGTFEHDGWLLGEIK